MTERVGCKLEPLEEGDAADACRLYTSAEVRKYLGGPVSQADAEVEVGSLISGDGETVVWSIRRSQDGAFMGLMYLGPHHDGDDLEMSYALLPEFQGMGYATSALNQALEHAFSSLRLPRVVAETQAANAKSIRLLERVGMTPRRAVTRFGAEQVIYESNNPDFRSAPRS